MRYVVTMLVAVAAFAVPAAAASYTMPPNATVDFFEFRCGTELDACQSFIIGILNGMTKTPVLGLRACPSSQRIPASGLKSYITNAVLIDARRAVRSLRYYEASLLVAHVIATAFPCGDE